MRVRGFTMKGVALMAGVVALLLLVGVHQAMAKSSYLSDFNTFYPASASGTNARCAVCHLSTSSTGGGFNAYGNAFRASSGTTTAARLQKVETGTSINVNGGTTNLAEITAGTQPGWTTGSNPIFDLNGGATGTTTAPSGIGTLDPAAAPTNQGPILNAPGNQTVAVGQTLTLALSATDTDRDALTFAVTSTPTAVGMTLTPGITYGTATLTWTPTTTGNFTVTVTVQDAGGLTDKQTFTITVGPAVNHPPVLGHIGNARLRAGQTLQFTVTAADPDGDQLAFAGEGLPTGATLTDNGNGTATFLWTPPVGTVGSFPVTITVTDTKGLSDAQTFTITVRAARGPKK